MVASFFNSSNNLAGYIANVGFALAALATAIRIIYKILTKHQDKQIEDIKEELKCLQENSETLVKDHQPNGGSSSKDQWNTIQKMVEELKDGQDSLHHQIDKVRERIVEHEGYHRGLNAREE